MYLARFWIPITTAILVLGCGGTLAYDEDATDDAAADPEPDPVPDPVADTTPDPVPDPIPDPTPDPGTDPPPTTDGCADGTVEDVFAGGNMVGCAGTVGWPQRDTLCAAGFSACSAEQWVSLRAGGEPTYNYWVDDELLWTGRESGDCAAVHGGGNWCGPDVPMRVCTDHYDPAGNVCNWIHCGLGTASPDQWFGGCQENPTAGTLCCR